MIDTHIIITKNREVLKDCEQLTINEYLENMEYIEEVLYSLDIDDKNLDNILCFCKKVKTSSNYYSQYKVTRYIELWELDFYRALTNE